MGYKLAVVHEKRLQAAHHEAGHFAVAFVLSAQYPKLWKIESVRLRPTLDPGEEWARVGGRVEGALHYPIPVEAVIRYLLGGMAAEAIFQEEFYKLPIDDAFALEVARSQAGCGGINDFAMVCWILRDYGACQYIEYSLDADAILKGERNSAVPDIPDSSWEEHLRETLALIRAEWPGVRRVAKTLAALGQLSAEEASSLMDAAEG